MSYGLVISNDGTVTADSSDSWGSMRSPKGTVCGAVFCVSGSAQGPPIRWLRSRYDSRRSNASTSMAIVADALAANCCDSVLPAVMKPQPNWWSDGMPPPLGVSPGFDATPGAMLRRCGEPLTAIDHWLCPVYEPPNPETWPSHQGCAAIQSIRSRLSLISPSWP